METKNKIITKEQLRISLAAAKSYMSSIGSQIADMINEICEIKADKPSTVGATIATSGWVADTTQSGFSYRYDLPADITEKDFATVTLIDGASTLAARSCGIWSTNISANGYIKLYATSIPTRELNIVYRINKERTN